MSEAAIIAKPVTSPGAVRPAAAQSSRRPLASTGFRCRVETSSGDVGPTPPNDAVTDDTAFSMIGVAG
jgi:hypothetical protein